MIVNKLCGTTGTEIIPSNDKSTFVMTMVLANITSAPIKATVKLIPNGQPDDNNRYFMKDVEVEANGLLAFDTGKLALEPGDKFVISSNQPNALVATISFVEME
jgi:hypothetical protein